MSRRVARLIDKVAPPKNRLICLRSALLCVALYRDAKTYRRSNRSPLITVAYAALIVLEDHALEKGVEILTYILGLDCPCFRRPDIPVALEPFVGSTPFEQARKRGEKRE